MNIGTKQQINKAMLFAILVTVVGFIGALFLLGSTIKLIFHI